MTAELSVTINNKSRPGGGGKKRKKKEKPAAAATLMRLILKWREEQQHFSGPIQRHCNIIKNLENQFPLLTAGDALAPAWLTALETPELPDLMSAITLK